MQLQQQRRRHEDNQQRNNKQNRTEEQLEQREKARHCLFRAAMLNCFVATPSFRCWAWGGTWVPAAVVAPTVACECVCVCGYNTLWNEVRIDFCSFLFSAGLRKLGYKQVEAIAAKDIQLNVLQLTVNNAGRKPLTIENTYKPGTSDFQPDILF